jgi:hypothetical protein
MKLGFRQAVASGAVFAAVLTALVLVDDRVHDGFRNLVSNGVSPWGERATDLAGALFSAARQQSIENAPLVIFAVVGAVLVLFMLRA